jgi:hypothetical protein
MNTWIPDPVAVVWVVLFAMVAIVHLGHAAVMGWRHRIWHAGHVVMAIGMGVMFWPGTPLLGLPAAAGIWVYGVLAGLLALALAIIWWRGVRLGMLWLVSVVDFAAMAYMFAMMSDRLAWLSVLAAAWFTAQLIGWASGWLGAVLERGGLGEPGPVTHAVPGASVTDGARFPGERPRHAPGRAGTGSPGVEPDTAAASESAGAVTVVARAATAVRRHVTDGGRRDWSVRITLAVMAAGMGYMMLAMQFGMTGMGAMSGM